MADLSKFAIGCISDEKYIPLLKSFLSSIASNSPNVTVYITLVDCKQYESELRRIFPRLDIKHDSTDLSPKRKNLVRYGLPAYDYLNRPDIRPAADGFKGPRWLVSDRACYCSNIRYRVILEMMKKEYDPILFMDVDAIVRKDLYDLGKAVMCHDISIMKEERGFRDPGNSQRFAPPDGIDWHCGIIGVKNNNICEQFFTQCRDRTEADILNWDADQDQFNASYNTFKDDITMYHLPIKFKDEGRYTDGHLDSSYIWCGSGEIKYMNSQYIEEQKKYECS